MSEAPPDFRALARRYLDLWQDQVAAMANDPALAEAVAQSISMMTQMPAAFMQAAAGATAPVNQARAADAATPTVHPSESGEAGTAAAAVSPDGARVDIDELARRLAAVEERLAAVEARLGGGGGKPAPKPRGRRPRRVD